MKKVLLKKFLICILIVMVLFNFLTNIGNVVYADAEDIANTIGSTAEGLFSNVITGVIGVLLYPVTLIPTAILIGISDIIGALANPALGAHSYGQPGIDQNLLVTPFHILFNEIELVDINFFDFSVTGTILHFRQAVAGWYYTMRLIASMILLVILIYLGLRMALTSIATEKAIYKKMLVDWATSLALLFLLHYIMLFVFECNDALVNAMKSIAGSSTETTIMLGTLMTAMQVLCFHWDIVVRISALAIYGMLVFQTISFLISYIKRMFTIGFLIIIAPLITITYSIDKIGDGKAQALNTWLKEFSYNILLQPFQCILYLVFAQLTWETMLRTVIINNTLTKSNVGLCLFAILSLQFIKEGEKLVKKIFGFGKASTVGDLAVGAAITAGALMKGKDVAKKYGGAIAKTKNRIMSSEAGKTMRKYFDEKKLDKSAKRLADARNGGTSTKEQQEKAKEDIKEEKKNPGTRLTAKDQESMLSKRQKKRQDKMNKKIEQKAQKIWNDNGFSEEYKKTAEGQEKWKEIKDKAKKNEENHNPIKNISGATGSFGGALSKASGEAISGVSEFIKDHKKDIAGMTVGMFTAGIGLAAGDFGDFSKAVAGYGMGKGFTEGIYAYSAKELTDDLKAAAQLYANMTGVTDIDAILANAEVNGLNELSKMIKDAKKDIESMMKACQVDKNMMGDFSKIAIDDKNAGSLTKEMIGQMLDKNGFKGTDKIDRDKAIEKFANLGELLASQTLYKNIQNAEAMEIDRETLAGWVGDINIDSVITGAQQSTTGDTSSSSESDSQVKGGTSDSSSGKQVNSIEKTETSEYKEIVRDMSITEIADEIEKRLDVSTNNSSIEILNLQETQRKIENLNVLIEQLNQKSDQEKSAILNAVNKNNTSISSFSDIKKGIEDQISFLKDHENKLNT